MAATVTAKNFSNDSTVASVVDELKHYVGRASELEENKALKVLVAQVLKYVGVSEIEIEGNNILEIIQTILRYEINDKTINEITLANQQKEKDTQRMQSKVSKAKIDELQALLDDINTTSAIDQNRAKQLVADQIEALKKKYSGFSEEEIKQIVSQKKELQKETEVKLSQEQPKLSVDERTVVAEAMAAQKIIRAEILNEAAAKSDISATQERIAQLDEKTKADIEIGKEAVAKAEQIITELEGRGRKLTSAQREIAMEILKDRIERVILGEQEAIAGPEVVMEGKKANIGPTLEQELVDRAKLLEIDEIRGLMGKAEKELEVVCESELVVKARGEVLERDLTLEILNKNPNVTVTQAKDYAKFAVKEVNSNRQSASEVKSINSAATGRLVSENTTLATVEQNVEKLLAIRNIIYNPVPVAQQIETFQKVSEGILVPPTENNKVRVQMEILARAMGDPKLKNMLGTAQSSVQYINRLKASNLGAVRKFGEFLGKYVDSERAGNYINMIASIGSGNMVGAISGMLGGFGEKLGMTGLTARAIGFIGTHINNPAIAGFLSNGARLISGPGGLIGGGVKALGGFLSKKAAAGALGTAAKSLLPKAAALLGKAAAGLANPVVGAVMLVLSLPSLIKGAFDILKYVIPGVFIGLFVLSQIIQGGQMSALVPPGIGGGQIIPQGNGLAVTPIPVPTWDPTIPIPEGCPVMWPIQGTITQGPYGAGCSHQNMSDAIDIAPDGSSMTVVAAHNGVVRVGADSIYGNFVDIQGSCKGTSFVTRYGHMATGSIVVTSGQTVTAGTPLGTVDNTGNSTGTHLHFDVRGDRLAEFETRYSTYKYQGCCLKCNETTNGLDSQK